MEGDRTRDAGLDHDLIERLAALHGPAFELAALHLERLAVLGLGIGGNSAVRDRAAGRCWRRGRGLQGGELALGRRSEIAGQAAVGGAWALL
jgi:hypothetical protein